ncbi:pteridine reductase [Thermithiobacillus tepidarius DSM 3134]|uniref:pteridine reductase n=1 Tax=Thermithiobacillus tepidarius TaxID=929 RepID=UPI000490AD0D|nr:pteridine reductase [Thermithiobacillus tepidarius]
MANRQAEQRVAFITGAAKRVGAGIAEHLAARGMRLAIHYNRSRAEAEALAARLSADHGIEVLTLQADLRDVAVLPLLVDSVLDRFGRLDALVNNASAFYPTPVDEVSPEQWDDLLNTNLRAPFFLAQAAAAALRDSQGAIVNIADIYGERPLANYLPYSVSKAGLIMLTKGLAKDLGPAIRVNAVAPGVALWAEGKHPAEGTRQGILAKTALKRAGSPADVAAAVAFFLLDAPYVTGQVLAVDGGRGVY